MGVQQQILYFVEGDLKPDLAVEWEKQDISGFTIKLHVRRDDGVIFSRTAVIDDVGDPSNDINAQFRFEWQTGDLVRGRHEAEIEVFYVGGANETFQGIILEVSRDIGS